METNSNLLQEVYNDDMLKKTKKSKDLNEIIEPEYDDIKSLTKAIQRKEYYILPKAITLLCP